MHIKNLRFGPAQTHRHFVAAPLFVALLLASHLLVLGEARWTAFTLPAPGMRTVTTDQTTIFYTQGLGTLDVADLRVTGVGGGFFVSLSGDALTIAALTTPVLLERDEDFAVVPAGWQRSWNLSLGGSLDTIGSEVLPLPDVFLREHMDTLRALALSIEREDIFPKRDTPPEISVLRGARFSEANERTAIRWRSDALGYVRQVIADNDIVALRKFLKDSHFKGDPTSTRLLGDALGKTPILAELISLHREDKTFWLLASLHPLLRDTAWTLAVPPYTDDSILRLRVKNLPLTDTQRQSIDEIVLRKWEDSTAQLLETEKNPEELFSTVIDSIESLLARLGADQYPERSERYTQALKNLIEGFPTDLAGDLQARADTMTTETPLAASVIRATDAVAELPMIPEKPLTPDEAQWLRSQALVRMRDAGAMFTMETALTAIAGSRVQVSSIVFAGSAGDRMYDFIFDVDQDMVSAIVRGGETFLYPLSLEDFVRWVQN